MAVMETNNDVVYQKVFELSHVQEAIVLDALLKYDGQTIGIGFFGMVMGTKMLNQGFAKLLSGMELRIYETQARLISTAKKSIRGKTLIPDFYFKLNLSAGFSLLHNLLVAFPYMLSTIRILNAANLNLNKLRRVLDRAQGIKILCFSHNVTLENCRDFEQFIGKHSSTIEKLTNLRARTFAPGNGIRTRLTRLMHRRLATMVGRTEVVSNHVAYCCTGVDPLTNNDTLICEFQMSGTGKNTFQIEKSDKSILCKIGELRVAVHFVKCHVNSKGIVQILDEIVAKANSSMPKLNTLAVTLRIVDGYPDFLGDLNPANSYCSPLLDNIFPVMNAMMRWKAHHTDQRYTLELGIKFIVDYHTSAASYRDMLSRAITDSNDVMRANTGWQEFEWQDSEYFAEFKTTGLSVNLKIHYGTLRNSTSRLTPQQAEDFHFAIRAFDAFPDI